MDYYCLYHIDHRKGLNKPMERKYDHQIKQNNGKENMFKHIFQGYILPKDKQSMISMTGYNVENPLGKGGEISRHYPYNGVRIIEQETFSIGLRMFLLKIRVSQTCFEIALTWSSGEDQTLETRRIHQE